MNVSLEEELVLKIKQKKELCGLSNSIIRSSLEEYLSKDRISLETLSEKEKKLVIKEVRANLRLLAGRFQTSKKSKKNLLDKNEISSLLQTHSSTAERINNYGLIRDVLGRLGVRSILDLGCGLNPIALASKGTKYYASDINSGDLSIVSEYFRKKGIVGLTFVLDIRHIKDPLPETDVCLMLKLLDVVDPKHTLSEEILKKIPSKNLIVSFSTKKLSGKKMNFPKRFWFEKLLNKLQYKFQILESENELFYVIEKN